MNDLERTFRDGLRQAVADRPGGVRVDVDEVIARASAPDFVPETRWMPPRWLAAAAAVLVVAGLGVGLAFLRPSAGVPAVPAAPAATSAPSAEFDAASLVGSKWWAVQIDGRSVGADESRVPYLQFTSDSEVMLFDGCNTGVASYRLASGLRPEFSVTLGGMTAAGCLTGDHARFDDALTAASSIRKNGELLEFLDPNDIVVLKFARADGASPEPTQPPTNGVAVTIETASAPNTPSPTPTPTDPPTASSSPTAGVHVRIYNDTGVTLHKVKVGFPGGLVIGLDTMEPGTYSEYMGVDVAYQLASLEATADGHPYKLTPDDYVGEQPLKPGNYTYRIRLTEGVMFLEFGD